ncbi:MAG: hypothetical protein ABFQ62_04855 [Patescibacteria group bacterium]
MRRREKFVLSSIFLSLGLLAVQYVPLEYRYAVIAALGLSSYLVSAWALSDDLQKHEWLTIIPLPSLYSMSVALFYFLLPENILSRFVILLLFGVGMYTLYLTANIFSVAKGRTIQLLHAAHAVGLMVTLLTSLLFLNTIFSLRLSWYVTGLLIFVTHLPLIFLSLWSVRLESHISKPLASISGLFALVLSEIGLVFCFYPFSVWYSSLLLMSFLYLGLGLLHNHLQERLFKNTLTEYLFAAVFIAMIFIFNFPLK